MENRSVQFDPDLDEAVKKRRRTWQRYRLQTRNPMKVCELAGEKW